MIPEEDISLTQEEIERWPAFSFYLSVLEHLAPGAVRHRRRATEADSETAADAWSVAIPRGNELWFVSVDPALANPTAEKPFWRSTSIQSLLAAMRTNLGSAAHRLHACPHAVKAAWNLLLNHPTRPMSVGEVAAAVDLSAGHLGERYEEIMGSSFRRSMRDERIAASIKQLENSRMRVSEIAAGLGGQSLSQFNRNFVAATGVTPSSWRENFARNIRPLKNADIL